jgi:hypothetical protein
MRKKLIRGLLVFNAIVLIMALATPNLTAKQIKPNRAVNPRVTIPNHAIEIIPGKVFWLGTAVEKGRLVEGYAIIHPKKGFARPSGCNNDGKCQGWEDPTCGDCSGGGETSGTSTCYGSLAKGAKWKAVEDYIVDTDNLAGLNDVFIRGNVATDIDRWEDAADGAMNDGYIINIIGDETTGAVDGADLTSPDGKNEVLFGNVDSPGAIAVTIVWGIFRGPPAGRELVEWDQVYDDWDYDWSEDCESYDCTNKMDFENIAIHELGHTFGLGDLYEDACSEETMYGYAVEGETSKRTLGTGDITGIYELYN